MFSTAAYQYKHSSSSVFEYHLLKLKEIAQLHCELNEDQSGIIQ